MKGQEEALEKEKAVLKLQGMVAKLSDCGLIRCISQI